MRVIGIDTAIRKTGYGVMEFEPSGVVRVLDCGLIRNAATLPHSECLRRLAGGIRQLIEKYHPDSASIESAFVHKNVRTAMILSLARGAVITVFAENTVPVYEYSPKTAKRAATGNGEAGKEQVSSVIAAMTALRTEDIPDDATDALALALCHANYLSRPELGMQGKPI